MILENDSLGNLYARVKLFSGLPKDQRRRLVQNIYQDIRWIHSSLGCANGTIARDGSGIMLHTVSHLFRDDRDTQAVVFNPSLGKHFFPANFELQIGEDRARTPLKFGIDRGFPVADKVCPGETLFVIHKPQFGNLPHMIMGELHDTSFFEGSFILRCKNRLFEEVKDGWCGSPVVNSAAHVMGILNGDSPASWRPKGTDYQVYVTPLKPYGEVRRLKLSIWEMHGRRLCTLGGND